MAIPYFIKKTEADTYDAYQKEFRPLRIAADETSEVYGRRFQALLDKYPFQNKSIFDDINRDEYYTYFLGCRLDNDPEFRDKMVKVADEGAEACIKAVTGK